MIRIIAMLLIGCYVQSYAQVTIFTTSQQVAKGEVFTTDVKVKGFEKIVSMQFSMKWDTTVVELIGVENYGLEGVRDDRFGLFNDGLRFAWIDDNLSGVTVADSSTIFSIKFKALSVDDIALIEITNTPAVIEVVNVNEDFLNVTTDNGTITVGEGSTTSTTQQLQTETVLLGDNQPNPFFEQTWIPIEVTEYQIGELKIWSTDGKCLKTLPLKLTKGSNHIQLSSNTFPNTGVYYYQLLTKNYAKTKKLAVLR